MWLRLLRNLLLNSQKDYGLLSRTCVVVLQIGNSCLVKLRKLPEMDYPVYISVIHLSDLYFQADGHVVLLLTLKQRKELILWLL